VVRYPFSVPAGCVVSARRFDHDRARALRAEGWTYQRIADEMGVTIPPIWRAVNAPSLRRTYARTRADELQCSKCERWLPDDGFTKHTRSTWRRGRHTSCRDCRNRIKREKRRSETGSTRIMVDLAYFDVTPKKEKP
jgi:hypothetical protein